MSSRAVMSESMLTPSVVCWGMTVVEDSGFPSHYDPAVRHVRCPSNVGACEGSGAALVTKLGTKEGSDDPPLAVMASRAEYLDS